MNQRLLSTSDFSTMPPKGWRKDAQGNYPTKSYIKEQENVTINDLLFPRSTIIQIAKDVHNATQNHNNHESDNVSETDGNPSAKKLMINKDASIALQRSATVFVNYLLMFAREIAKDSGKKSCNVDDIMLALDHIGFSGFKSIINDRLIEYQRAKELKKTAQSNQEDDLPESTNANNNNTEIEGAKENNTIKIDDEDNNVEDNYVENQKRMRIDDDAAVI